MPLTASKLRENIYSVLDEILESGIPVEVERKGRILRIVPDERPSKLSRLQKRDCIIGDPLDLVHSDWLDEWSESH